MKKLLAIMLAIIMLIGCAKKDDNVTSPVTVVKKPEVIQEYFSKLDGHKMSNKDDDQKRIFAVMFDNSPKARMQAGISKAALMYEIRVEADATRFIGIFNTEDKIELGPIRSARPYHVHLAAMHKAIFAHHGASQNVLDIIPVNKVSNINGMNYDGSVYQRKHHKVAPHNSYTTIDRLNAQADNLNYRNDNDFEGFNFNQESKTINGSPAKSVYISYGNSYTTEYKYNENSELYDRYITGQPHLDENDDSQIAAKNIIIRLIDYTYDPNGVHKDFYNTGSGDGFLLSGGEVIKIKWNQDNNTSSTNYTNLEGKPITLNPGQTWIQWIESADRVNISE